MQAKPDQWTKIDLREIDVVLPSLNRRWSGVTATVVALLPHHQRSQRIAVLGHQLPKHFPHIGWGQILTRGWYPPEEKSTRIWHARRNVEMLPGVILSRVLRQPWKLVFTSAAQRHHSAWTKFLLGQMDAVIATSHKAASYLRVPHEVSFHGVDTNRFTPALDRGAAWAKLDMPGQRGVGIFGRVRHQKGSDLFVESLIALLGEFPEWTAVFTGQITAEETAFAEGLKAKLRAAQLDHRVVWLGLRPVEEIPQIMRALSLIVAPPRTEGFGLIPLEAMASGTAVIASDAGTHAEQIIEGETGSLFPAGDGATFTQVLGRYLAMNEDELAAIGAQGRAHVLAYHRLELEAARIEAVYASLQHPPSL